MRGDETVSGAEKRIISTRRFNGKNIETRSGKVLEFDANQLRLLVSGDEVATTVAANRVLWIQPGNLSELEAEAIRLFVAGDFGSSLVQLPDILFPDMIKFSILDGKVFIRNWNYFTAIYQTQKKKKRKVPSLGQ